MNQKKFLYWMAVPESEAVRFSELAHRIAKAMHSSDNELAHYGASRLNLEAELLQAVRTDKLIVRNPAGMGRLTYPYGHALQSAVVLPSDLEQFLAERGVELRLTPHGSGPVYWTLENVAAALQVQEGWHDGTRATFQDKLQESAQRGELTIRDPQTCLPMKTELVRTFWELVTPLDVNAWLERQGAPYRWNVDARDVASEPQDASPSLVAGSASNAPAQSQKKAAEQRQAYRWQLCVDAGLTMPTDTYAHLPRGIHDVADKMNITRQALAEDLNKYRERVFGK